jgi:hypothetical protein
MAFTSAAQSVWWLVAGLGAGILALGLVSTGHWARATASRAAALFEVVDQPATPRPAVAASAVGGLTLNRETRQ